MNLLILLPDDRIENDHWQLSDHRARHLRTVLGLRPGDTLRAGLLGGMVGTGTILDDDGHQLVLSFVPLSPPPPPLPLQLILALPRPLMLKRIVRDVTSLGVQKVVLLNSSKVDKSYWQTPELHGDKLREKMLEGLSQAKATVLPEIIERRAFRHFVEDELLAFCEGTQQILAHPGPFPSMPHALHQPVTLAVGPEGGWTDFEVQEFCRRGFSCHSFGSRILRVETAIPALVGRLMAF